MHSVLMQPNNSLSGRTQSETENSRRKGRFMAESPFSPTRQARNTLATGAKVGDGCKTAGQARRNGGAEGSRTSGLDSTIVLRNSFFRPALAKKAIFSAI